MYLLFGRWALVTGQRHKFLTLSNQTSSYISKCIRMEDLFHFHVEAPWDSIYSASMNNFVTKFTERIMNVKLAVLAVPAVLAVILLILLAVLAVLLLILLVLPAVLTI